MSSNVLESTSGLWGYSPFFFHLYQHTCVGTVCKDVLHRSTVPTVVAIIKVPIQAVSPSVLDRHWELSFIQILDNPGHTGAVCSHLKDIPNDNSSYRIRYKLTGILIGFLIPEWSY